MSEEMPSHRRRPYRKRRRAQQEDETRLRITEAAVELMTPEEGVSPGQACVFYETEGSRVLGGGWIWRGA